MKTKLRRQPAKYRMTSRGFTLVELLVAIVILGILSTIGLRSFSTAQQKARDSRRKQDIENISKAVEVYFNDKGVYPLGDTTSGHVMGCDEAACGWGEPFLDGTTYYMTQMPEDPLEGWRYWYVSDGSEYQIYARLENTDDPRVPEDTNGDPLYYSATYCTTSGLLCNIGVPSTNSQLSTSTES